jgi:magnesium transporter
MEQTDRPTAGESWTGVAHESAEMALELSARLRNHAPKEVAKQLAKQADQLVAATLQCMHAPQALEVMGAMGAEKLATVRAAANPRRLEQWDENEKHVIGTLGRLMELPAGVFAPESGVADTVEQLRELVKKAFITYLYIVDAQKKLVGLVAMRELVLANQTQTLGDIMLREPFSLLPDMSIEDGMKAAVARHYPVYPICGADGQLIGLVRGEDLFEQTMVQVIVQAGSMVGVEKEERVTTAWPRSLRLRHPWLQLNLVTAMVAGFVVSQFEGTLNQLVVLAAFLPILAGQSGNTGCQALAVTLRGMTLGDLADKRLSWIVSKEAMLGLMNGAMVGVFAGLAMYFYAINSPGGGENALTLALVVWLAMVGSCVASGVTGTLVPIALKKFGADPATASSIFLTTATDVVSMGLLLGLASVLVL